MKIKTTMFAAVLAISAALLQPTSAEAQFCLTCDPGDGLCKLTYGVAGFFECENTENGCLLTSPGCGPITLGTVRPDGTLFSMDRVASLLGHSDDSVQIDGGSWMDLGAEEASTVVARNCRDWITSRRYTVEDGERLRAAAATIDL